MTGMISLSWTMTNEDQLCAIAWKVKQRFTQVLQQFPEAALPEGCSQCVPLPFPAVHELAPCGNEDMLRWITRFQLSVQRMQEAWNDTYLPITDPNNAEARAFVAGLPAEEQDGLTNEETMERANVRRRDQHARTVPITANLVALIFVSLSDLTQDQRQVLTSLMAHRSRMRRLPPERAS